MRRYFAIGLVATSVLLFILTAWLLLRPDELDSLDDDSIQLAVITPDLAFSALQPVGQVPTPTSLASASTADNPAVATLKPTSTYEQVRRITPIELQRWLNGPNPPLVWEVRTPDRYAEGHIAGSRLVQLHEVAALAQDLNRNQAIIISCD